MKTTISQETDSTPPPTNKNFQRYASILAWLAALSLVIFAMLLGWRILTGQPFTIPEIIAGQNNDKKTSEPAGSVIQDVSTTESSSDIVIAIPPSTDIPDNNSITRNSTLHTTFPNRVRQEVQEYFIVQGDSVFDIAARFNISPESVLWANYALLNDNPHAIYVGMELNIPPVNGVLYVWQAGDTLASVADRFNVDAANILEWPENDIDLTEQDIETNTLIMIPGGQREFKQWIIPTIPRGRAGVSRAVYGGGACEGGYEGVYGDGAFIWPADNHKLSGNDYWSGHLGIDIAAGDGARIYAADSGVVVFAGWATGGYGNTIVIDHGTGYQTLYGHLSGVNVVCGQSVGKGSVIGYSGSTGNSTGAHLHFEIRYQGGFVNPWYVLPTQ